MPDETSAKRGRPRVREPKPGAAVLTWLTTAEYDRIIQTAKQQRTSVSALVRLWVRRQLKS